MPHSLWRAGVAVCLGILLGGAILHTLGGTSNMATSSLHTWGSDDAYISYRYARNLAQGKGLVFNPGERVEAYSNLLYVLLIAPAFWLTDNDGVYCFAVFLNLAFAGAALLIFVADLRRRVGDGSALAGAVLLACCLPLWVAVASGLETSLVLAVSLAVWVWAERVAFEPAPRAVFLLCLAMVLSLLARADGFIIAGFALFYLLLKRRFRALAICAAAVALTLGAGELWRLVYYGNLLPNTYYVKVTGSIGPRLSHAYEQLSSVAVVHGLLPFLLIIPFGLAEVVRQGDRAPRKLAAALRFDLLFPLLWLAYWFYIGGDHFWDRFLIILYPLGIFALLQFFSGAAPAKVLAFVVMALALMEIVPPFKADPRFAYRFDKYDAWVATGKLLGQKFPGKTLATVTMGKIPFFSGLYTEDMLGLADPILAHKPAATGYFDPGHMKFDADYSLARKPDLIADWIHTGLDLPYGLTRAKYQKAGYHIRFLIYVGLTPPRQGIVDTEGWTENMIDQWVARGFEFAILVRSP